MHVCDRDQSRSSTRLRFHAGRDPIAQDGDAGVDLLQKIAYLVAQRSHHRFRQAAGRRPAGETRRLFMASSSETPNPYRSGQVAIVSPRRIGAGLPRLASRGKYVQLPPENRLCNRLPITRSKDARPGAEIAAERGGGPILPNAARVDTSPKRQRWGVPSPASGLVSDHSGSSINFPRRLAAQQVQHRHAHRQAVGHLLQDGACAGRRPPRASARRRG